MGDLVVKLWVKGIAAGPLKAGSLCLVWTSALTMQKIYRTLTPVSFCVVEISVLC